MLITAIQRFFSSKAKYLLIFCILLHCLPFLMHPKIMGGDEPHYTLMAHSIAIDGDFDLQNNYADLVTKNSNAAGKQWTGQILDFHIIKHASREFFYHPLGLPLLLAPIVKIKEFLNPGAAPDWPLIIFTLVVTSLGVLAGWQLLADYFKDKTLATVITLTIYFTTPLWFYSRTLFTEPYIWSFAVFSIYLITRQCFVLGGILAGIAFWIKEPSLITTACIALGAWYYYGTKSVVKFACGMSLCLALALYKNYYLFGDFFVTFQPYVMGKPIEGIIGTLFDPTHGLLIYAPILLMAIYSFIFTRPRKFDLVLALSLVAILLNYLLVALWRDWAGGACYGPRLLLTIIPLFALALGRLWLAAEQAIIFRVVFMITAGCGFLINWSAALRPHSSFFNSSSDLLSWWPSATIITGVIIFCVAIAIVYKIRWNFVLR